MFRSQLVLGATLIAIAAFASTALAQVGTEFTYQGKLENMGAVVTSPTDMQFSLWTANSGGSQIGSTLTSLAVPVTTGLFTVSLDFGVAPYTTDQALWLQIDVRNPAGSGSYVPMTSRQKLTATPFSLATRGLTVDATGNVGIKTTPVAPLDVAGQVRSSAGGNFIEMHSVGNSPNGYINTTSGGDLLLNDAHAGNVLIAGGGRLGIGTGDPQSALHVGGTAQMVGFKMPTGASNGYVLTTDASGTGTWQVAPGAGSSSGWTDDGAIVRLSTISDKVGIGTSTPGNTLAVNGPVDIFGTGLDGTTFQKLTMYTDLGNGVLFEAPLLAAKMPYHFNWRGGGPDAVTIHGAGGLAAGTAAALVEISGSAQIQGNSAVGAGAPLYSNAALSVKSANFAIYAEATGTDPAGYFVGNLGATGTKSFLQPHPTDASKAIDFVCLEGNEAGTYFRGSATLSGGAATIVVPEDFRMATEAEGLTVQVTPVGRRSTLWIESESLDRIEVRGDADVKFHYTVNGVRRGYRGLKTIVENEAYRPRERGVPYGTQYPKEIRDILVANGILNPDYTPNESTAARLGWKLENAPVSK